MQLPLVHLGCGAAPLITVDLLLSNDVSHSDGQYAEQHALFLLDLETIDTGIRWLYLLSYSHE